MHVERSQKADVKRRGGGGVDLEGHTEGGGEAV